MGYYVIKFFLEAYTLQDGTICDGQISTDSELVFKEQYLSCMQENTKLYWEKKYQQHVIIFPTRTIVNPCLDNVAVKDVHDIPRGICNINQAK